MKEEEKFLAGMLARELKSEELVFLHDNDDYIMQEIMQNFMPILFENIRSQHIYLMRKRQ